MTLYMATATHVRLVTSTATESLLNLHIFGSGYTGGYIDTI